uniref:BTB domain-containing protein n=1 Tax=Panagrolaimus sp. ES5 TaxID=591445 RepID=A0AC34FWZ8_9BILA
MLSTGASMVYKRKNDDLLTSLCLMQKERYKIFKEQDHEKGRFDVTFEVEGKMLHAHKFILSSVSEPLDSWISDRWSSKDAVIKIEDYPYDCFFQFLSFLYCSECKLTDQNIVKITDMAERYCVQCLKDFCDEFLFDMEKSVESIEELYEFANKYSLLKLTESIKSFFHQNYDAILNAEAFIAYKKPFVEFLFNVDISKNISKYMKEVLFKGAYKWAEHYVMKKKAAADDENFNLLEAIKAELKTILPLYKFSEMSFDFLMNFFFEKGFDLSPAELAEYFLSNPQYRLEDSFKQVYELAEKQAIKKQEKFPEDSFNLHDATNAFLIEVLPHVDFCKMRPRFLTDFVVEKGYLLSPAELAAIFLSKPQYRLENSFKEVYELAEKLAIKKQEKLPEDSFNLHDATNAYLIHVMPHIDFCKLGPRFLTDFVVAKGYLLSPAGLGEFFLSGIQSAHSESFMRIKRKHCFDYESFVEKTVELAEKLALKKQEMFPEDNFSLGDAIKAYMVDVIPQIKFSQMDSSVLTDFIGNIFSAEQIDQIKSTRVEIENNGKVITGIFKDVHRIRHFLEKLHISHKCINRKNSTVIRFIQLKFRVPSTPSSVPKMKGVD